MWGSGGWGEEEVKLSLSLIKCHTMKIQVRVEVAFCRFLSWELCVSLHTLTALTTRKEPMLPTA